MADGCEEEASGEKTPNQGYYEANFLVFSISDMKKAQYLGKDRRKAQ